jgi:type VI secretion system protein ImpK
LTTDDPFFSTDPGATVVRPMPGGRRPAAGPRAPAAGPHARQATGPLPEALHDNPLVACATDLLTVAGQLRSSLSHPDPSGLLQRLATQVRSFESCARSRGLTDQTVLPARYVLCALLDESVKDTPWGSQSVWTEQGLLIAFHNEAWGGDKFFEALDRLLSYPSGNLHLLELMYLCIAMGFEGRYRIREGGREQLERVRERLYQTIRAQRSAPEAELSPHWRGAAPAKDALIHQVPLWVLAGVAGLLLLGLFAYYTFSLSAASDPVYLSLSALDKRLPPMPERVVQPLKRPPVQPPSAEERAAPTGPTLRQLLADDIAAERVDVVDRPDGQTVIVRGEALFASARASLQPDFEPLIHRIGDALSRLPGDVLVTGHSDSAPIKTLRFPSNWHLSQARAETVAALLQERVGTPGRFRAEGRAATEPLVPENPRDARNRRVEIQLLTPPATRPVTAGASGTQGADASARRAP